MDSTHLEHLDEGNTEVQVGQVTANQTQAEEDTNGDDGTEVDPAGHLDGLSSIEPSGVSGEQLRRDSREGQVISGQDDGVS